MSNFVPFCQFLTAIAFQIHLATAADVAALFVTKISAWDCEIMANGGGSKKGASECSLGH